MSWIEGLKRRWNVTTTYQVVVILVVFALTGFSVMFLKKPVKVYFHQAGIWFDVLYYILILPVYNLILLFYGFIFGQFRFFWSFEKRMLDRIFRKRDAKTK